MKKPTPILSWLLPSIKNIFFLAVFCGVLLQGNTLLNTDGDLGHHLAMGKLILESRSIPQTDPFSFRTEGIPAIPHEWLIQVVFAWLDQHLGLAGIVLWCALLLATTFTLTFVESMRKTGSLLVSLPITGLALAASAIHWIARPHLVTYLILAVWVMELEKVRQNQHRRWWVFALLMLAWANMHGMFVVGLISLGLTVAGYGWQRWIEQAPGLEPGPGKTYLLAGLSSLLFTFLTPSGAHIWQTIFELLNSQYITKITSEYRAADFHEPATWPFLLLVGIAIASGALGRKNISPSQAALLTGWALLGFYSARNIPMAAIVMAPVVAEMLTNLLKELPGLAGVMRFSQRLERVDATLHGWVWAACGVGLLLVSMAQNGQFSSKSSVFQFSERVFPVQAANWLIENPQTGLMYNEFDWGGYLIYRLWPGQKIFMDGHTHIYGDKMSKEYMDVMNLEKNWNEVLEKYQVQWAIVRQEEGLATALSQQGWQTLYQDTTSIILRRP